MFSLVPAFLLILPSISCETYHRLLSPSSNSQLQIVPKVEIPIAMAPTVQCGMNLRLPITLKFPDRSSQRKGWQEPEILKSKSRALLYESIDKLQPSFGKICLLRSICEVSQVPLISPATGLIGEIVDLFLT